MKKTIAYIALIFICTLLILNPEKSMYYAQSGLDLCIKVIIPSLFPFFVCSGLLVYSGFCEILSKILSPVMRPLFKINSSGSVAFVLGLISGYPQGAVTTTQLYDGMYISKSEAERLLAFCNNSGPLFILGTVGVSMYHNVNAGILLYIAHILGAISVGIVLRFYKKNSFIAPKTEISVEKKNVSQIFSYAITNSTQSILSVCATVLFLSVLSNLLLDVLILNPYSEAMIGSLLEFVSGLGKISYLDIDTTKKLVLSAFVCAFAGISVHLQVMGVVARSGLSLKPYFFGKILHAFFSSLYTLLFLKLFPNTLITTSNITASPSMNFGFFIGSLCTVITVLSAILIFISFLCFNLKRYFFRINK